MSSGDQKAGLGQTEMMTRLGPGSLLGRCLRGNSFPGSVVILESFLQSPLYSSNVGKGFTASGGNAGRKYQRDELNRRSRLPGPSSSLF